MPRFDISMKRLVQRRPADWVRFLLPNCRTEEIRPFTTEKTPKIQSRMDEVFAVQDAIVHFETQSYLDTPLPARMLRYRADIWEDTLAAG